MDRDRVVGTQELVERWSCLRQAEPHIAPHHGAARLGVTEAELVAAHVGRTAVRLGHDWALTLRWIGAIGPVTALTRNEHALLRQLGNFARVRVEGTRAIVEGGGINLQTILSRWHVAFAVISEAPDGARRSLQFFDVDGAAIHEVCLDGRGAREQFERLIDVLRSDEQRPAMDIARGTRRLRRRRKIDVAGLRAGWEQLGSALDLQGLLDGFGTTRTQAFRLVGPRLAQRVKTANCRNLLREVSERRLPMRVVLPNIAVAQSYEGLLHRVEQGDDGWVKISDPTSMLHLWEAGIASVWLVRGLNRNGVGPHVELHDDRGHAVLYLSLCDAAGAGPQRRWRRIVDALTPYEDELRVCRDIAKHVW